jgi:calcium permeable stress-gated cation channel
MDAYFFVRFLRMMVKIFLPIWFLSWAVLLPVNSVNSHVQGLTGLDRFTFGNIEKTEQDRYAAHIILVYIFTGAWISVLDPDFRLLIGKFYASLGIL